MPQNYQRQSFPETLYCILNDIKNEGTISWMDDGKGFCIHNPNIFRQHLLPQYTRRHDGHKIQFRSFQRQLNLYGFRMNTKSKIYYNSAFYRGCGNVALKSIMRLHHSATATTTTKRRSEGSSSSSSSNAAAAKNSTTKRNTPSSSIAAASDTATAVALSVLSSTITPLSHDEEHTHHRQQRRVSCDDSIGMDKERKYNSIAAAAAISTATIIKPITDVLVDDAITSTEYYNFNMFDDNLVPLISCNCNGSGQCFMLHEY